MVSSEWVGRRGEFRDTRNNFAILARLNGGTTCSRGVERAGFKGIETRFDSFLVEFIFRVEWMDMLGTPSIENAGLEILLGIEVRWIYYLIIIEILMNNLSLLFYFKFARSGIIRGEKF